VRRKIKAKQNSASSVIMSLPSMFIPPQNVAADGCTRGQTAAPGERRYGRRALT
jgi:hypothetical protein